MTSLTAESGTSYGPELLVRLRGGRRRAQLEDRLRELVRDGTLAAGSRMPSSRALAGDLGVSRRLVVDAYAQLLAEGYLVARQGAGTYRGGDGGRRDAAPAPAAPRERAAVRLLPGRPRPGGVPARAVAARDARCAALRRPTARSAIPTRAARPSSAARSARTCGACAASSPTPSRSSSARAPTQGLALLGARAWPRRRDGDRRRGPGPAAAPRVLASRALRCAVRRSTSRACDVAALRDADACWRRPRTSRRPASCSRRARRGALSRGRARAALVIEDDYDAEFRYDRAPLGALQGLAPERVVYLGTASRRSRRPAAGLAGAAARR